MECKGFGGGIDVRCMQPHLAVKARLRTMRFGAFRILTTWKASGRS